MNITDHDHRERIHEQNQIPIAHASHNKRQIIGGLKKWITLNEFNVESCFRNLAPLFFVSEQIDTNTACDGLVDARTTEPMLHDTKLKIKHY